jgi:hypothetical protein
MESMANVTMADFATEITLKRNGESRRRHYNMGEIVDYKREMVPLYWHFQNEAWDILDRNKCIEIYEQNELRFLAKGLNMNLTWTSTKLWSIVDTSMWKWATRLRHSSGVKLLRYAKGRSEQRRHQRDFGRYSLHSQNKF